MSLEIPDKQFFKIGEVSRIVGVKAHVLRYWETEFSAVRPSKTRSNQRLYRRRDVDVLLQIKELLYDDKYTIAGAIRRLRQILRGEHLVDQEEMIEVLQSIRGDVEALLELVEEE